MIPLVSIIVPVYNVQPYLRQCMESLVGQTLRDIEIICVDGGSTDGSSAILAEYAAKDGRIRVITQENAGLSAARNAGLDTAAAPLIMFCDSDDWYAPVMCEKMYAAMQNGADMAVCGVQETTQGGNLSRTSDYFSLPREGEITPNDDLFLRINVVACNKIHRREIIEGKQIRFPVGLHFEDEYFYAVYTAYIKTMVFVPDNFYFYRRREESITGQAYDRPLKYALERVNIACRIWQYHEEHGLVEGRLNYLSNCWLGIVGTALSNIHTPEESKRLENIAAAFAKERIISVGKLPHCAEERLYALTEYKWVGIRCKLWGLLYIKTKDDLMNERCCIITRIYLFGVRIWKYREPLFN